MPYHEIPTEYALHKKSHGKKALSWKLFYNSRFQQAIEIPNSSITEKDRLICFKMLAEYSWYKNGCPYYNVHTNLISRLCNTDLSKIPSSLFKLPHCFNSVQLRFKDVHKDLKLVVPYSVEKDFQVASIIICKHVLDNNKRVVTLDVHFIRDSAYHDEGLYSCYTFTLHLDENDSSGQNYSLQKAVENSAYDTVCDVVSLDVDPVRRNEIRDIYRLFTEKILKLCCTIGFLADNANICEPDLLTADKHLIETASPEELEALHQKARRKRKYGYNIGTDRMFLGPVPLSPGKKSQAAESRELEYAHIRGGHPHAVRYGKGKELVKIMWYVPLTVRPDLPFKLENPAETTV